MGYCETQARSQVLRFVGKNTFSGAQDFYFYYMFQTIFSGNNKIWEQCHPVPTGLRRGKIKLNKKHWSIRITSRVRTD